MGWVVPVWGAALAGVGMGLGAGLGLLAFRAPLGTGSGPVTANRAAYMPAALVEVLAAAIDAKLDASGKRLVRRRAYATALAGAVGMPASEVAAVGTAALLLDVGQLAVPDHILSKPGPLSVEEFHKVRVHPRVSADLLHGVPFDGPVEAFVRSHHERWDGKGYPDGLAGEAVPRGARVLAIVDCYDALVSERPYRGRLTRDAALAVLRDEAGKSLDPDLVQAFIEHLPALEMLRSAVTSESTLESILSARREDVALREISQAMSAGLGVKGTAQMLAEKLQRVVASSSMALYTYDAADSSFRCAFAEGVDADLLSAIRVSTSVGIFGQAIRDRRAVPNGNPQSYLEQHRTGGPRTRLRASIVSPLHDEQQALVGALAIYHVTPACYTQDECRLFEMIARQAGPVVSHALQLARAQEDALTDELTGLPNTRFLWMHLTQELARASRQASNLALLLLDVDNFKQINDTEGHPMGDLALRELSALLRTSVRPYDVCARYGGDEFVIMMPECGGEEAEERLHELQARIGTMRVTLPDGRQVALGVSIGGAVFPRDGDSADTLLMAADSRMYQDKTRWRERGTHDLPAEPFSPYVPSTTRRM
jgi:diguanylate cyclase (GGDEF)-like protein